ncbi:hypothetical protein PENSPDRAFT_650767 [Peniophora sp. CONT]|nr:hypothetical protein PENSPDRAFT_650767 [Peniophora sp. CONT]
MKINQQQGIASSDEVATAGQPLTSRARCSPVPAQCPVLTVRCDAKDDSSGSRKPKDEPSEAPPFSSARQASFAVESHLLRATC